MAETRAAVARRVDGYGDAVGRLSAGQKPGGGAPAYLRWVNRPLGRRLAACAHVVGLSPNQVTLLSALASAIGIALIAAGGSSVPAAVGASVALLLGYALDSADGQLARLVGSSGPSGEYLDHVVDAVRLPAVHLAIAWSLSQREDLAEQWPILIAVVFASVSSVWFFALILAGQLHEEAPRGPVADALWISFVRIPLDVSFVYLLILFLPWASTFVLVYGAVFVLSLVLAVVSVWRKFAALRENHVL
jgi:phosphatidylglycerophosphate synthase